MDPEVKASTAGADSLQKLSRSKSAFMQDGTEKSIVLIGENHINPEADTLPKFICLDALPPEVRANIAHLDTDGDGFIDQVEVGNAVDEITKTKTKLRNTRCLLAALIAVFLLAVVGVILGGTDAVVKRNKDTKIADTTAANTVSRALLTKDDEPISTSTNEAEFPFGSLKHMPEYVLKNTNDFIVKDPQGAVHYLKKEYATMVPGKSTRVETSGGHAIWVDADLPDKGTLTHVRLADGTEWDSPSCCTDCHATSLVVNDEISAGLVAFNEVMAKAQEDHQVRRLHLQVRRLYLPPCNCLSPTGSRPIPGFNLPETGTSELVHGICIPDAGPDDFIAANSTHSLLTYTAVNLNPDVNPQAWDDRNYVLQDFQTVCGNGVYLRPSLVKAIPVRTRIGVTAPIGKTICVFYENGLSDNRDGGWGGNWGSLNWNQGYEPYEGHWELYASYGLRWEPSPSGGTFEVKCMPVRGGLIGMYHLPTAP